MKALFFLGLVAVLIVGCKGSGEPETDTVNELTAESTVKLGETAIKNAGISTGLATMEMVTRRLLVNGIVDVPPESLVSVSFPLGGYLKTTNLLPGRPVRKGQVIATMEDPAYVQLQQDYLQAVARLEMLKLEFQRQTQLREDDATSRKNFEVARADYEIQQILIKALSEKLQVIGIAPQNLTIDRISRTVSIRSPINGFVKSVFVNIGKYVNPSDVLFEIVDPDHIHGSLTVFEKDQHLVKQGQQVVIKSAGHPEKMYRGEVILVSRDVDEDRGVTIHSHFIGDHSDLLPGMYITAEIVTDGQILPLVPESAVVRHDGRHYVFGVVGDGSEYRMLQVETGDRIGDKVALLSNNIDWTKQPIVLTGAYALLGKLKNVDEE
ncbi:MAG TPA: efflux RND transporter periplasmic adaptor subunit [Phnomibacter sp.]|nr:efflux RND transporter periplasmic adaptor subunit [Phnomibacter sp.]